MVPSVIMRDQLCYVLLRQTALKIQLAVATHSAATHQRLSQTGLLVMEDGVYAMQDNVLHLFATVMVWKSVHVQPRKNFVICAVKRKGECALQQRVCLRYEVDG